jgi:tripartite-type tricarboxylate transporter receptor subunit TctC
VVVVNWYGLVAPKGTPKPIIELAANETIKAARSPDMAKRLVAEGSEAVGTTPPSSPPSSARNKPCGAG